MKGYHYIKVSSCQWAWGPTAHWRLYYSLKTFGKRCASFLSATTRESNNDQDIRRRPGSRHRRYRHTSNFDDSLSCFPDISEVTLTDNDVNEIIRENETTIDEFPDSQIVERCEINQLKSNEPNEDQIFLTQSSFKDGLLFGVLDGHGGAAYGEEMKTRLPFYLHTLLTDKSKFTEQPNIEDLVHILTHERLTLENTKNRDFWMKKVSEYMEDLISKTRGSSKSGSMLSSFSNPLMHMFSINEDDSSSHDNVNFNQAIREAFLRIDGDVSAELLYLAQTNRISKDDLKLANSGCCALVAYIIEDDLHLANIGDCRAVLGSNKDGHWSAIQLTYDHTAASNSSEVQRIISEHPPEEARSCLSYGRLLGRLAPLRALGDVQFKMEAEQLYSIFKNVPKYSPFSSSLTPPYLTAEPEVFHYKLEANDRFIVLASDGLWDMLSNEEVVQVVAAYMEGKHKDMMKEQALYFNVPDSDNVDDDTFRDVLSENVASFLLRQALGGYDKGNLKAMLSMKYPDTRLYRDDISIVVIFLANPNDESFAVLDTSQEDI